MKAVKALAALSILALLYVPAGAHVVASGRAASATEQTSGSVSAGAIRGRVVMPDGSPVTQPIRVTLSVLRGDQSNIYTDSQGLFEINNLAPGSYTLEIEEDRERKFEPTRERVEVFSRSPTLVTLYLKEKTTEVSEKPNSNVVSSAEFDEKVPAGALREFERGTKAGKEGKLDEAVEHLRKAVAIYPDYLKARNDLATYLLAQGKLDEAVEHLRKAIQIDPKAFNPQLNLGIVLVGQHDFSAAASALEKALSLDAASPAAHLYAGLAYVGLGDGEKAERELTAAYKLGGSKYSLAQFHLGHLYMNKGERALALKAFETYLRDTPDAANADEVRRLIGILR
jgi:tetratricopeptide (TPR) repeat protein